jgi:tubulin polyglutamylase TTLL6/13
VLVLSCDPLKIFIFKEGLVRFATQEYNAEAPLKNMFAHLTNYSLNKESGQFREATSIHDDTGHKRSLSSLFRHLVKDGIDVDELWSSIKDCIVKTFLPIQKILQHDYRVSQPEHSSN